MAVDIRDLNPEFKRRIDKLMADAEAAGISSRMVSAFRDNALQKQLYDSYQAGTGGVAAPPGRSYHNYGLAADVIANDPANQMKLIALANDAKYGLHPLGSFDPPHFQMAGVLDDLIKNPPKLAQSDPSMPSMAGPVQPNSPSEAGPVVPGTTLTTPPPANSATSAVASAATPSIASMLSSGDVKGAIGAFAGDKDMQDGLKSLTGGGQKQGQGQSAPQPLSVPNLQDNSAQIASMAPQLLAALIAKRRSVPGLSLGGYGV